MIRIHSGKNVLVASLDRIRWIFDEFMSQGKDVVVSSSGGKDSTVVFELSRIVAKEFDTKLQVMWLDQECEYEATANYVRWQMHQPDIEPFWFQVPFKLTNSTSHSEHDQFLHVWDPTIPDQWVRPKEPDSIHDNVYGVDRFYGLLHAIGNYHWPGGCNLIGMRTEEAPGRRLGMTSRANYKWITWAAKDQSEDSIHWRFNPIYDWSWRDVWKAIHEHSWPYNIYYDVMYQQGIPVQNMRVSNYHHEKSIHSLFTLQEIEPETYARATQRLEGLHTAAHLGKVDFLPRTLPFMFDTWLEYRDYLLEHLPTPDNQRRFIREFGKMREQYPVIYAEDPEGMAKIEVESVVMNDWEFVVLQSQLFRLPLELKDRNGAFRRAQKEAAKIAAKEPTRA